MNSKLSFSVGILFSIFLAVPGCGGNAPNDKAPVSSKKNSEDPAGAARDNSQVRATETGLPKLIFRDSLKPQVAKGNQ